MSPRASRLLTVAEHTVMACPPGLVLDVGCRDFVFSREMGMRGHNVIALDPDPTINPPADLSIRYERLALRDCAGEAMFEMDSDPQARRLSDAGQVVVNCITMDDVMKRYGVDKFSIVKLDCEGAEYGILENWPGPVADQVTVEFHEHVCPQPQERYDRILSAMGTWYDLIQHQKSFRHCLSTPNYWDTLWTLR